MNRKKFIRNIGTGFVGQLIIIILGLIVPRIMITSYGSDTNGLLSTISQIFAYMALLEAGIGQAAKNALYKPISQGDRRGISHIASIARRYFRKVTIYYGICVLVLSLACPIIIKTDVDSFTVFLVVLFEGLAGVISFYFVETPSTILMADGRGYVNSTISVVNKTISYAVKIVMAAFGINIAFLQFVYFLLTVIKVFFYRWYFYKKYSWIDFSAASAKEKLKDRNAFIVTEIAWTIFSSTDMIVLSVFVSTKLSSVYSVYSLVFSNLNLLLNSVYSSVSYVLGCTFHEDEKKYVTYHDAFTTIFMGGMTILMCITYILILPFIRLYTNGVTDVEYIYTILPVMFCLVQILSWSRYVSGNLTGLAGYAKTVSYISIAEAIVNLFLSVLFVQKWGIIGVLFATVVALPIKVIYCTYVCDKKILRRSVWRSMMIFIPNYLLFAITIVVNHAINLNINNYLSFAVNGCIVSIVCFAVGGIANYIANPECIKIVKKIIKKR